MIAADLEAQILAACRAGTWDDAATVAIRGYGPELLGFLNALVRDPSVADDLFGTLCEKVWRGLPRFAWQSSFRTWAYAIARNVHISFRRGAGREVALPSASALAVAAEVRSATADHLRTTNKDMLGEVRASLDPDDQALLTLRLDRQLPWREIAQIFEADDATPAAIDRRAAALRKRLERLRDELRERLSANRS
jgi:RNA polymerase sigma-70 factor (ECF subfamily)